MYGSLVAGTIEPTRTDPTRKSSECTSADCADPARLTLCDRVPELDPTEVGGGIQVPWADLGCDSIIGGSSGGANKLCRTVTPLFRQALGARKTRESSKVVDSRHHYYAVADFESRYVVPHERGHAQAQGIPLQGPNVCASIDGPH